MHLLAGSPREVARIDRAIGKLSPLLEALEAERSPALGLRERGARASVSITQR